MSEIARTSVKDRNGRLYYQAFTKVGDQWFVQRSWESREDAERKVRSDLKHFGHGA